MRSMAGLGAAVGGLGVLRRRFSGEDPYMIQLTVRAAGLAVALCLLVAQAAVAQEPMPPKTRSVATGQRRRRAALGSAGDRRAAATAVPGADRRGLSPAAATHHRPQVHRGRGRGRRAGPGPGGQAPARGDPWRGDA